MSRALLAVAALLAAGNARAQSGWLAQTPSSFGYTCVGPAASSSSVVVVRGVFYSQSTCTALSASYSCPVVCDYGGGNPLACLHGCVVCSVRCMRLRWRVTSP